MRHTDGQFGTLTFVCVALVLGLTVLVAFAATVEADDWRQWRGVDRLGVWSEIGIVETLPDELMVKWRVPIGSGFAGPAVSDGRVFVLDWEEDPESRTVDGTERLLVLDEQSGEVLWTHEWETSYRMLMFSYALGPRATPTVDGNRVYVVGATGVLSCLDVETGEVIWHKNYVEDYDTSIPTWGMSSAPLVDGDRLITLVGGEPDAKVVAFDKRTGEELWRALPSISEMGYTQPVIYEAGGVRQLIIWDPAALYSLNPETGAIYWTQPWEVGSSMSVATPVKSGDYLLVTQFYYGSMMMRLNADRPEATMLWKGESRNEMPDQTDGLHSLITTPLIIGDYVYGLGSYGELRALDARTGERVWMDSALAAQARWGAGFLVKNGNRYFINNDEGYLVIAQFTPDGYVELGRTKLIEPTASAGFGPAKQWDRIVNWTHPAYANRHIVQRNDREIIRASLATEDY